MEKISDWVIVVPCSFEEIRWEVLRRVNPTENDKKKVQSLANSLTKKVERATKKRGIDAEVRIEGSVAKDTWLRDCPEIDVFMQVDGSVPRKEFGKALLDAAKEATKNYVQIERYAEHPYVEAVTDDGIYLNVVPCFKVKQGNWISATDRTPFHTDYIKPHITPKFSEEVRLLKRFMKGINVYGAEIKVGGFSGYLSELLILNFGSFLEVLRSSSNWEEKTVIDYEKHYMQTKIIKEKFSEPLIMVDPVDKERNVAAAVRKQKLDEFISASREFLKTPSLKYFFSSKCKVFTVKKLVETINHRGSSLVFLKFATKPIVPDILWGQLYKSQKALRKIIIQHEFTVLRDAVWSNEKTLNVFVFELENQVISSMKHQLGPPLHKRLECERFLQKHVKSDLTLSGPRIEKSRWVVDVKRNYTNAVKLLKDKLADGGKQEGLADSVVEAVDSLQVFVNDEISNFYANNSDFAEFLTQFLDGKPVWLS